MKSNTGVSSGLVVDRLVKNYGAVTAVDNVSFTVGPGKFVSLLGPSGCGKTTTLRCIAGFERPNQGRISINGDIITDTATDTFTPPNRRQFGMVFQSYAIWPHMNVFDNVAYPLKVQGKHSRDELRSRVRDKLRTVGLANHEERYPSQLSGGQQQRVALARALVMEPKVLLFDEPLSNLDAKLRERMRFELIEIQRELGIPAVYVTHDQSEAMVMSDHVIVMEGGRVAQEGAPEQIYLRPTSRFVADFIGLSNFVPAKIEGQAPDGSWITSSDLGHNHCRSDGVHAPGDDVLVAIRPERIELSVEPFTSGNVFTTELRKRYFLGPYTEYFVGVGNSVLRAQSSTLLDTPIGKRLYARVFPEHCQIVARDSQESVDSSHAAGRESH